MITIKEGKCQIQGPKQGHIAQVNMTTNRMFPLYIENAIQSCFAAKVKNSAWIWHLRYGHLHFNGLKTLYQQNMVKGLPHILSFRNLRRVCYWQTTSRCFSEREGVESFKGVRVGAFRHLLAL